jgi:hypothetical protein
MYTKIFAGAPAYSVLTWTIRCLTRRRTGCLARYSVTPATACQLVACAAAWPPYIANSSNPVAVSAMRTYVLNCIFGVWLFIMLFLNIMNITPFCLLVSQISYITTKKSIALQHHRKGFGRDVDLAEALHALFALGLLGQDFLFA